jgi:molybdopterin/thiamine biosynthesis adenylyltransferase
VRAEEDRLLGAGVDVASISEATAVVVVDGMTGNGPWAHPAWALCRGLGALGFGGVELRGAEEYLPAFSFLMQGVPFRHLPAGLPGVYESERAAGSEVVLYLGSDPLSREACLKYATERSSSFVSIGWGRSWVEMSSSPRVPPSSLSFHLASDEGPVAPVVRIAAGLALQETLILVGQLRSVAPPDARVSIDAAAETRSYEPGGAGWPSPLIENVNVDAIGSGAVGTNFLESFAPLLGHGCELRIFDFDEVGPENLATQAAFCAKDVGKPKAQAMAEKLAPLCDPSVDLTPVQARYEERAHNFSRPSLRIVCPDSWAAREHCNDRSLTDGVPLVEAGCSPLAAQVRSYLPGVTACLEHRIQNLPQRAATEQDHAACSQEQAFTLPGTSMICGGLLAAEALRTLHPERFGPPSLGTIGYDARFGRRFGVVDVRAACSHP